MKYYTTENIERYKDVFGEASESTIRGFLTGSCLAIRKPDESFEEFKNRIRIESNNKALDNLNLLGVIPDLTFEEFVKDHYLEPEYLKQSRLKFRLLKNKLEENIKYYSSLSNGAAIIAIKRDLRINYINL